MSEDEEIIPGRGLTVFGCVDLFVSAVHTDPEHLHEDPAAFGHLIDRWLGEFRKMDGIGLSRDNRHGFHRRPP
jgi:hypothetical protein